MCEFPSRDLLSLRRWAARMFPVETGMNLVIAIDRMRHEHLEKTGCTCWQDAVEEAKREVMQ